MSFAACIACWCVNTMQSCIFHCGICLSVCLSVCMCCVVCVSSFPASLEGCALYRASKWIYWNRQLLWRECDVSFKFSVVRVTVCLYVSLSLSLSLALDLWRILKRVLTVSCSRVTLAFLLSGRNTVILKYCRIEIFWQECLWIERERERESYNR